jgi:hypothetical protein
MSEPFYLKTRADDEERAISSSISTGKIIPRITKICENRDATTLLH